MEMKTYFASSVPAALELARRELGQDAMLVGSRPAPPEARSFGRLEVTFAHEGTVSKSETPVNVYARMAVPAAAPDAARSDMEAIRQEIASLRSAFRGGPASNTVAFDPAIRTVNQLVRSGLEEETAREIAEAAGRRPESIELAVRNELQHRVRVQPFVNLKPGESRTLAFVGPTGRGKTTSLVKVAVRFGLAARIPTRIYSAGVHQVGAAEQMARYATILGVPFYWYETVEALHLALNGEKWKGLALIDTPGLAPANEESLSGWERIFRLHPDIERHLVLRADARSADVSNMIGRLEQLHPTHLLFTGLDEVAGYSALIEGAIRSELPLCFAGNGTRIPEDLMMVDSATLIRSVWAEQSRAEQSRAAAA